MMDNLPRFRIYPKFSIINPPDLESVLLQNQLPIANNLQTEIKLGFFETPENFYGLPTFNPKTETDTHPTISHFNIQGFRFDTLLPQLLSLSNQDLESSIQTLSVIAPYTNDMYHDIQTNPSLRFQDTVPDIKLNLELNKTNASYQELVAGLPAALQPSFKYDNMHLLASVDTLIQPNLSFNYYYQPPTTANVISLELDTNNLHIEAPNIPISNQGPQQIPSSELSLSSQMLITPLQDNRTFNYSYHPVQIPGPTPINSNVNFHQIEVQDAIVRNPISLKIGNLELDLANQIHENNVESNLNLLSQTNLLSEVRNINDLIGNNKAQDLSFKLQLESTQTPFNVGQGIVVSHDILNPVQEFKLESNLVPPLVSYGKLDLNSTQNPLQEFKLEPGLNLFNVRLDSLDFAGPSSKMEVNIPPYFEFPEPSTYSQKGGPLVPPESPLSGPSMVFVPPYL